MVQAANKLTYTGASTPSLVVLTGCLSSKREPNSKHVQRRQDSGALAPPTHRYDQISISSSRQYVSSAALLPPLGSGEKRIAFEYFGVTS